jgi:hypothetical protein
LENKKYVICYNKECEVKKICGHYCSRHPKEDGGYIRCIGSGNKDKCHNFDDVTRQQESRGGDDE